MPMLSLTVAERKALKARAHHLDPVVLIGDAGLTDAVLAEISRALDAHELIKVRVGGDDREARQAAGLAICERLDAAPVQHIGKLFIVWRPRPEQDAPALRPRKPRGPRKTKKQLGSAA